jgi:hypothetical protein
MFNKALFTRAMLAMGLALVVGLATSLGAGVRGRAEAASQPAINVDSGAIASPDTCTATQTGYGYGGYGYGGYGYGGYGMPYGFSGVYGGGIYGTGIYGAPFVPTYAVPNYTVSFPCNGGNCISIPFYTYSAVCPGPPASIRTPIAPTSVTCASASNIEVSLWDANGFKVADGTGVDFTTTFGQITGHSDTVAGAASASLTTPTKTSGNATIYISSGAATASMNIAVTCSTPGSSFGASSAPSSGAQSTPASTASSGGGGSYGGNY